MGTFKNTWAEECQWEDRFVLSHFSILFTSLILYSMSLFVWTEWKALQSKFWLVLQLIPSRYCWIIAHYLYPSCHNNSWMPVCDNVLTARALTWWEKWKQKHDSMHVLTACTLFCLIEFHCEAVQHTPLKTYQLNEEMRVKNTEWHNLFLCLQCHMSFLHTLTVEWAHLLLSLLMQDGSTCGQPRQKWWCT